MQIWKDSKYAFQEKQGRGGGVSQSGKFPDYTGFFLLKASLTRVCSFFLEGKCVYDKDVCWFKHEQLETTQNSTILHKFKEYICGFCGKLFENKNECMMHRKKEHVKSVSECFENENGWCRFGDKKCWFRHEMKILNSKSEKSVSENSGIETTDMIKRLFDIW